MANEDGSRRHILVNGEVYIQGVAKPAGGGPKKYPRSYDEARDLILHSLSSTEQAIGQLPKDKRVKNVVVAVRIDPAFIAKSYYPDTLLAESRLKAIGSRRWLPDHKEPAAKKYGKMIFVKTEDSGFSALRKTLDIAPSSLSLEWKHDVQKVELISLLSADEQILGFPDDWKSGSVESVLHPLGPEAQ